MNRLELPVGSELTQPPVLVKFLKIIPVKDV